MPNITLEQEAILSRMTATIKATHEKRAPKPWEPPVAFTVAEWALVFGLSESTTRNRLRTMEEAGLVVNHTVSRRNGRGNVDMTGYTTSTEATRAAELMQLDRDEAALYGTTIEQLRADLHADAKRLVGMLLDHVNNEAWMEKVCPRDIAEFRADIARAHEIIKTELEIIDEESRDA